MYMAHGRRCGEVGAHAAHMAHSRCSSRHSVVANTRFGHGYAENMLSFENIKKVLMHLKGCYIGGTKRHIISFNLI